MYYGIKPVFVFDGGVPLLKKETVRKRGRKEDRDEISLIAKRLLRDRSKFGWSSLKEESGVEKENDVVIEKENDVAMEKVESDREEWGDTFKNEDNYQFYIEERAEILLSVKDNPLNFAGTQISMLSERQREKDEKEERSNVRRIASKANQSYMMWEYEELKDPSRMMTNSVELKEEEEKVEDFVKVEETIEDIFASTDDEEEKIEIFNERKDDERKDYKRDEEFKTLERYQLVATEDLGDEKQNAKKIVEEEKDLSVKKIVEEQKAICVKQEYDEESSFVNKEAINESNEINSTLNKDIEVEIDYPKEKEKQEESDSDVSDESEEDEIKNKLVEVRENELVDSNENRISENELAEVVQIHHEDKVPFSEKEAPMISRIDPELSSDIQKLLQLFGVPYLIAPMEAEAQCAFLEMNSLVDGIVTDDNDVFLFGGENILRHFFSNSNSELLNYKMSSIREKTGWSRNELIDLALLLGGDYCNGLKGIGKVKAKEILNHFQSIECFVEWFLNGSDENVPSSIIKLRNKIILPDDFNDYKVRDAYLNPTVDQSMEPFQWGSPDFDEIAKFLNKKTSLSIEKAMDFLSPLIQRINEGKNSENSGNKITDYFEKK
ncbi:XPG-I domain-containing protein [Rozella allomycis CSF55]|uniref:XPG-I domain-containing protein n=1 Tax=Rozella allomycis (strain CSF55) TaxID=988480 RepID=A0A075ARL4_ROZAC|nr:XPG-I domain-containing protein [Rozella allomycis CSF55]|eukprot:EPZ31147.1 XPG-I domain-containing protein [Rozella allomycis CSF55]